MKPQEEFIVGDQWIAEFMVGKPFVSKGGVYVNRKVFIISGREYLTDRLKYHSSWSWIMRVVEKISQIEGGKFSIDISSVGQWACYIKRDDVFDNEIASCGGFDPIIINVWKAVVAFLQWYNKQKLK